MKSNLEIYKKDIKELIDLGNLLDLALKYECKQEEVVEQLKKVFKKDSALEQYIKKIPSFNIKYQGWYSESLVLLKQLLPDRLPDFRKLYEKPKTNRKNLSFGNYVIEDALQGVRVTRGFDNEVVVDKSAAIPQFEQQLSIMKSIEKRFTSSLFDIRTLLQADLFDSEIEIARELNKKGFVRGAGAIAGVVLEGHLSEVCENHSFKIKKKHPTISDFNELLKKEGVIEISVFRKIQYLADLRNKCDHKKKTEPTKDEIEQLINGANEIIKTIF